MWLITLRDLQYRRRRFVIAVLATAVVFAMTLLITGVSKGLDQEIVRITDTIGADAWVVSEGTTGPFTATTAITADAVDSVASADGVQQASPIVYARATVGADSPVDVNVLGVEHDGVGTPDLREGRMPRADNEIVVSAELGEGVGDRVEMSGATFRVVGKTGNLSLFFGNPTVFTTVDEAQELVFGSGR